MVWKNLNLYELKGTFWKLSSLLAQYCISIYFKQTLLLIISMLKLSRPGATSNNYKERNDIAISPEITKVVQKLKQRSLYMASYSSDPKRA